jgi:serine/threonine protein phosphatase PrpC
MSMHVVLYLQETCLTLDAEVLANADTRSNGSCGVFCLVKPVKPEEISTSKARSANSTTTPAASSSVCPPPLQFAVTTANIGDSRAVLIRDCCAHFSQQSQQTTGHSKKGGLAGGGAEGKAGGAKPKEYRLFTGFESLTRDHKPLHPVEKKRILDAGGTVVRARVDGNLAVARAFGDGTTIPYPFYFCNCFPNIAHLFQPLPYHSVVQM